MDHDQRQSNRHPRRATMLGHTHAGACVAPAPGARRAAAARYGRTRSRRIAPPSRDRAGYASGARHPAGSAARGGAAPARLGDQRYLHAGARSGRRSVRLSAIPGWLAGDHDRRCFRQRSAGSAAYGGRADGVPPRGTARRGARPDAGGYQSRRAFGDSAGHGHDVLCHAGHPARDAAHG